MFPFTVCRDQFQKPYSDETATLIDEEVRKLVDSQYERAKKLLIEKRNELEILANALLENEVLLKSDVVRLIGLRPNDIIAQEEDESEENETPKTDLGDIDLKKTDDA